MQRHLVAVAALVAAFALSACAQRGGGAHGGSAVHAGGFSGQSAPAIHSSSPTHTGFAASRYAPTAHYSPSAHYAPGARYGSTGTRASSIGVSSAARPGYNREGRARRPYVPAYGFGLPYSTGWVGLGYPGYFDSDFYDNSAYASQPALYPDQGYANPGYAPNGDLGYPAPPVNEADAAPAPAFRPAYQPPPTDPGTSTPVTLVYKDGRTEQIQNFMLTRRTLFVQEDHLRAIPTDDLDLALTEKINKEAGVDFQLPEPAR